MSGAEFVGTLAEKMVETDAERVVLKNQRRADLVLGVAVHLEHARVLERFQELELA